MAEINPSILWGDGDDLRELPEGTTITIERPDGDTTVIDTEEAGVFAYSSVGRLADGGGNTESVTEYRIQYQTED